VVVEVEVVVGEEGEESEAVGAVEVAGGESEVSGGLRRRRATLARPSGGLADDLALLVVLVLVVLIALIVLIVLIVLVGIEPSK